MACCSDTDTIGKKSISKLTLIVKDITDDIGDVITAAIYPITGLRFLKWKYGLEEPPAEVKARTLEDVKREDELIAKAKAGQLVEKA